MLESSGDAGLEDIGVRVSSNVGRVGVWELRVRANDAGEAVVQGVIVVVWLAEDIADGGVIGEGVGPDNEL